MGRVECNPPHKFAMGVKSRTSENYPPYIVMILRGGILSAWSEIEFEVRSMPSVMMIECNDDDVG